MEFFIMQNATLPLIKMEVVKDGRSDYTDLMNLLETSLILFSMVDTQTGIPKIVSAPANIVERIQNEPGAPTEYYVYFKFTAMQTNTPGRYMGQFMLSSEDGNLILPIREQLYINIQPSFVAATNCC
jgi:hypothetical protein